MLSKARGSENGPARSDGFDSFVGPTKGIAEGNPLVEETQETFKKRAIKKYAHLKKQL
ncbi:MAG TPA: hypothetical protein VK666_15050 [Chryseolinea sp.]|nr:hypothetical protein [Chryseolinea sp.]